MPLPAATTQTPPAVTAPAVPTFQAAPPTATYTYADAPAEAAAPAPTKYFVQSLLEDKLLGEGYKNSGFNIYGWTQLSYTFSSARRSNLPLALNDRADQFQMNQNYLVLEKHVDTSNKEFQLGFQTDFILPGTDTRFTLPRGLWNDQLTQGPNGGPKQYPIDMYQFFAEAFLPNLGPDGTVVKVGRFATHIGYETVQAVTTPFLPRSYLFQYNPFTHTGVWATTGFGDWSVGYGVATGNDTFIDPANRATFLGQIKYAPKDGKNSIAFNTSITDPSFDVAEAFAFYNVYDVVYSHIFNDNLTGVINATYSNIRNVPGIGATDWYGVAGYLAWKHNDCFTSNFRAELFEDSDGFRTGSQGTYQEYTYGLTYTPADWLLIRPFARFDYNADSRPFEGKRELYTGGIDLIVRW